MKAMLGLILILFTYQLHAAACKCNCEPASRDMCASSYDIERPCNGVCPGQVAKTACPTEKILDPNTNKNVWVTMCID